METQCHFIVIMALLTLVDRTEPVWLMGVGPMQLQTVQVCPENTILLIYKDRNNNLEVIKKKIKSLFNCNFLTFTKNFKCEIMKNSFLIVTGATCPVPSSIPGPFVNSTPSLTSDLYFGDKLMILCMYGDQRLYRTLYCGYNGNDNYTLGGDAPMCPGNYSRLSLNSTIMQQLCTSY